MLWLVHAPNSECQLQNWLAVNACGGAGQSCLPRHQPILLKSRAGITFRVAYWTARLELHELMISLNWLALWSPLIGRAVIARGQLVQSLQAPNKAFRCWGERNISPEKFLSPQRFTSGMFLGRGRGQCRGGHCGRWKYLQAC
eukprot:jgi/Botrbrau1/3003/Bobra.0070s0002.1